MVDWKKEILSKRMDIPLLPTWAFLTQRSSFSLQLDAELHRRGFGDAIPRGPELASLARPNINPFTHKLCCGISSPVDPISPQPTLLLLWLVVLGFLC